MRTDETEFQLLADNLVERVLGLAEDSDLDVELYFCIQQVQGSDPEEPLAYLLRNGERDAYFATDALGRVWFCDCMRSTARELSACSDLELLADDLFESLSGISTRAPLPKCH
jgi:hypothetical protein